MKSKEMILKEIENIQKENIINEDRKNYFMGINYFEKVQEYEKMITGNNIRLEILEWISED